MINPNDKIKCKKYGKGICKKIDPTNKDFMYFCKFDNGTLVWLSKWFTDRYVRKDA